MSIPGAYFFYQFSQLLNDMRLRGNLTGVPVAYLFFAKLLTYGFAVALLTSARRGNTAMQLVYMLSAGPPFSQSPISRTRS